MKRGLIFICVVIFLCSIGLFANDKKDDWQKNNSGTHYSYEQSEFTTFQYKATEGELNGYTLSPGGAPDGYSYVAKKTVASAGTLNVSDSSEETTGTDGVKKLKLNGTASATAWIAAHTSPVSFTLSMNGELTKSGTGGSVVSWSASAGTNFFWVYPFEKIVAEGQSVSFAAKENGSNKESTWKINHVAPKDNPKTSSIIFNRNWWDIPGWFDTGVDTPKAGDYVIEATADGSGKKATAALTIVGAEFKEGNSAGFDDYTNWTKNTKDYYGSKTGKCINPYIAVKDNNMASIKLTLNPSNVSKPIEIVENDTSIENLSPTTTLGEATVSFRGDSNLFSSEGEISAELDGTTIATATACVYNEKTINVLFVKINGQLGSPNFSCFSQAMLRVNTTSSISYHIDTLNLDGVQYTVDSSTKWTRPMLRKLRDDFYAGHQNINIYDYVQFQLIGNIVSSRPGYSTAGLADGIPARDSWTSQQTPARTYPHELGHCLGLYHNNNDQIEPSQCNHNNCDISSLMCQSAHIGKDSSSSDKLRKDEWDTIHAQ